MSLPVELRYVKSHEWLKVDGDTVVVGITDYAQDQLGEVVYVELPDVDATFDSGDELGTLESVKAVSEYLAPLAGDVVEVNERLEDEPNLVNQDPYGDGWLVKMHGSIDGEDTMDAAEYEAFLESENS
jgi:glycine cleavage system H protein